MDSWFNTQEEIAQVVSPAVVAIFFISWIWIASFIFRNIFIGVMGMR